MSKTDHLDEQILEILTKDARISNREVGRLLNVSDVTIGKRLKSMQRAGSIRLAALIDPAALGLNCAAFIRLKVVPAMAREIAAAASELKEVPFVALTGGTHNVVTLELGSTWSGLPRKRGTRSADTGVWRRIQVRPDARFEGAHLTSPSTFTCILRMMRLCAPPARYAACLKADCERDSGPSPKGQEIQTNLFRELF